MLMFTIFVFTVLSLTGEWIAVKGEEAMFSASGSGLGSTDLEFNLPGYERETVFESGIEYTKISYANEGELLEIGKPDLPCFSRLLAIPNSGRPRVEILSYEEEVLSEVTIYPQQELQSESQSNRHAFLRDELYYTSGSLFPEQAVQLGTPAIMRGLRVVNVTINPFRYDPVKRELRIITNIHVSVNTSGIGGENEVIRDNFKLSRAFEPLYRATVLNYSVVSNREDDYQAASYLFIHTNDPSVEDALSYLTEWKHEKGFEVSTEGFNNNTSFATIKSYIQTAYDTWENPPEYVCLVGDAEGTFDIPTDFISNGGGDQGYARLDGNDILADVYLGRLSFETITELQTIIYKILYYEKEPYLGQTEWYEKALMVGDPSHSGTSTIDTKEFAETMMLQHNPNYVFDEYYIPNCSPQISASLNSGVSYFNYRGYLGMSGFGNTDILNLNNGFMLPVATIPTCGTGTFYSGDSRSEVFLRAGSPGQPKGAIASFGTATISTHTCFNNIVDAGTYYGLFADKIFNMGGALTRGKLALYMNYPNQPSYVQNFSYWNTLMGDPGMEVWTGVPQPLVVNYENQLGIGANTIAVNVQDADGQPVEGAWVTALMGDDEIFATGYTDAEGNIVLSINAQTIGTAKLTVTKHDYIPHLGSFDVGEQDRFVNIFDYQIDDDNVGSSSGNGDGEINPGESIELRVELKNFGTSTANNVTAVITSDDDFITITDDTEDFGNISSGTAVYSSDDFDFSISAAAIAGLEINLIFQIEDSNGNIWSDYLSLPVKGANLVVSDYNFPNNPNGSWEPGETTNLSLTIENLGTLTANNVYGILILDDDWFTINTNDVAFGSVNAGGQITNNTFPFEVTAASMIIPGTQFSAAVQLYNADGYDNTTNFMITVGEAEITDPLGPDAYGYYCYDDGDVNYYNVPEYNWIDTSNGTQLNLNDPGETGDIDQISNLPITFKFYGIEYNSLTVSSNGWICPGNTTSTSFMNWQIPGPQGPSPMIAPFWDDLVTGANSSVKYLYDSAQNYFVITWENMKNEYDTSTLETFQVILYDSNYYPTSTGDSEIKFQYQEFNNVDIGSYPSQHGQYCTVGIEDHTGLRGIQYTFNNDYPTQAKTLNDETAILFTGAPIQFDQPYLVLGGITIDDENGNGQADYGETVDLEVIANNLGDQAATGITSVLTSNDPYITITQNSSNYNAIAGSGTGSNLNPFTFEVAENCPDGHNAPFVLNITSYEDSWELQFVIELNAPLIEYGSHIVDDSNLGNNNSIFDPGETVNILLGIVNNGGSNAYGVEGTLSSPDPYITVNTTTGVNFGNMPSGNSATHTFSVTANSSTPYEHPAQFHMEISADNGITESFDFVIVIGVDIELFFDDFESGLSQWNIVNNGGSGVWTAENPPYPNSYTLPAPSLGAVASADADETYPIDCEMILATPLDCSFYNEITLEFDNDFNAIDSDDWAYVDVSNDGGSTWHNVLAWNSDVRETHEMHDISNLAAGEDNVLIRFYSIQPGWDWWWAIDNVTVYAGGSPVALGTISGVVTDADSGQPIADVNVSGLATTAADGTYEIYLVAGTYDIIFDHDDYFEYIAEDVIVLENQTTNLDVSLTAIPVLNPPSGVTATIQDFNDVLLSWNAPVSENEKSHSGKGENNKTEQNKRIDSNRENSRELSGYRVYRNDVEITTINNPATLSFLDTALAAGDYEYYVTAVYDSGESEPSNLANIEVILPAPQNLSGTVNYPNIELSWNSPQRALDSYQVYRDNVMIAENVSSNFYIDENVPTGTYYYKVRAVYSGGWLSEFSNEIEIAMTASPFGLIPEVTSLRGNYPNPFNPATTIQFGIHKNGFVGLNIYNIKGEKVRTLIQEELSAGYHSAVWNGLDDCGKQASSGIYFYKLKTADYEKTAKMIMMK